MKINLFCTINEILLFQMLHKIYYSNLDSLFLTQLQITNTQRKITLLWIVPAALGINCVD